MPLPSFFQRFRRTALSGRAVTDAMPLSPADVEATRTRARRRLIGMAVLVGAGLIAFPWLFETQPRPMSGDVRIVQAGNAADGEVQISGTVPPAHSARSASGRVAVSGIVAPADSDEPATSAGTPPAQASTHVAKVTEEAPASRTTSANGSGKVADKAADKDRTDTKAADKNTDKNTVKAADKPSLKDRDGAKSAKDTAKEAGKDKSADKDKTPSRYVVQFGAFADVNTAHEARMKVERLGLKTYTQQVDTPAGKRIRVRMGPYADKAEADKAMATLRKANLSGAVLTL